MLQTLQDILQYIQNNKEAFITIGTFLTSIGVEWTSKIKYTPWTSLFKFIGKNLTDNLSKEIQELNIKMDNNREECRKENEETNRKLDDFIANTNEDNVITMKITLLDMYRKAIRDGYILEKDDSNFHDLLNRYYANGGNSYIKDDIVPRMEHFRVYLSENDAHSFYNEHGHY